MTRGSFSRALLLCLLFISGEAARDRAGEAFRSSGNTPDEFTATAAPLFQQYCFKCHSDKKVKARLNLQQLSSAPDFARSFRTWEKVVEMLGSKEMPPEDEKQPGDAEREKLIAAVRDALDKFIRAHEGDPGPVAMRRLTSAEFACSIQDLTGLDIGLERNFTSDAVGGEGFSNVGDVQFIQDSTLEHYLEAAKQVASHAVIGAGPLHFSRDPGKSGQELSAIRRIQEIYQEHGFRTASGEGGEAFGLERYAKAFFAVWRFKYRTQLGLANSSLAMLAAEEGVDTRFAEHLLARLEDTSLPFPGSEIVRMWQAMPAPAGDLSKAMANARTECARLYERLQTWQISFAENTGDAEVASVLTETSFRPSRTNAFRIRLAWPPAAASGKVELAITPALAPESGKVVVAWRQPTLRFRKPVSTNQPAGSSPRRPAAIPLREVASAGTAKLLKFGIGPRGGDIGTNDFVTSGSAVLPIEFNIPAGMTQAELLLEGELQLPPEDSQGDCVVRCVLTHNLNEGATAAATGTFSLLLSNPNGSGMEKLKAGVVQFARAFPQISHREAAPADRDPIPPPFNSDYNNAERNEFHATIKYHRDDTFLTEHILDDRTREELDQAWTDLLTSFDYHQTFLRFLAKKFQLDPADLNLQSLTVERIETLPEAPRRFARRLFKEYVSAQRALKLAEPGHLEDALEFARKAWRRPLDNEEKERLRSFYARMRRELDHPPAMRALLTRILVSPAFLYRIEQMPAAAPGSDPDAEQRRIPLSDWELASRLSYLIWCSIPDQELWRAAEAGELHEPSALVRQAGRMLRDPKARRFATEFFGQWFGFYRFDGYRGVDTTRFTEFTESLKSAMYDEAVTFFEHIIREDRPVHEILFADYAFLNRDLASHYGISGAEALPANDVTRVDGVNRYRRGGLLRMGAVLTSTSAPLRTSAVKRGDWILRRVLGRAVPPPPGDAGSIPPDDVLPDGKTVRERLEQHRRDPSCVNCHARMDPLGFALEHFDSIGRWRETYRDGQKIDASGKLMDGTEIREFEGLNEYLRVNEALFNRTLCSKLLGFALGRSELVSDRPLLDRMASGLQTDNRFSTLIEQIVTSPQFRYRRAPAAEKVRAEGTSRNDPLGSHVLAGATTRD